MSSEIALSVATRYRLQMHAAVGPVVAVFLRFVFFSFFRYFLSLSFKLSIPPSLLWITNGVHFFLFRATSNHN